LRCIHAAAIPCVTTCLVSQWGDYGIRSIGVSPGAIADTAGTAKLGGMGGNKGSGGAMPPPDDDSVPRVMRMGTVDDIGNTCVFLCSEAGGWISGDTIQVDGAGFLRRGVPRNEEGLSNVDRAAMIAVSRDREKNAEKAGGFAQTGLPSRRSKL
jgi:enoyl-[acyl-carrier-protein] reductase (NADH)